MSANTYIPAHFPLEYDTNWVQLAQQTQSKLSPHVTETPFEGKSKDFNRIGAVDFQSITARAAETRITDVPTSKRRLSQAGYDKASMFDEWDEQYLGQISLPRSGVMASHMNAANRLKDLVIVTAALGDAVVPSVTDLGVETTSTVALPAGQKVAIDYVETGSAANSGLTIGKLRKAKFLFDDAEIEDDEERVLTVTAKEIQDLLKTTEVTNSDYNTVKALAEGRVDTFLGFKFKRVSSSKVLPAVAGVRYLPAFVKSGINFATTGAKAYMDVRADKSHALQIRHTLLLGAVRLEDEKVVQIAVDTTLP